MNADVANEPLEVYFDGSCPMCRAEIGYYRRKVDAGSVRFVDVSAPDHEIAGALPPGLDRDLAMARFHVREADGRVRSGADAFAALWRVTPGFRTAGRIAGTWGVRHALEGGYRAFLPVRPVLQQWLGENRTRLGEDTCADGRCQKP